MPKSWSEFAAIITSLAVIFAVLRRIYAINALVESVAKLQARVDEIDIVINGNIDELKKKIEDNTEINDIKRKLEKLSSNVDLLMQKFFPSRNELHMKRK